MEVIILIAAIIAVALEIIIIVYFFSLCNNVKKIQQAIHPAAPPKINKREINHAILTGKSEEIYFQIVEKVYKKLYLLHTQGSPDPQAEASEIITTAQNLCKVLNRDLPKELSSYDSFKSLL